MKTLIVYRLSAMGDVAMLLPILRGVLNSNPDLQIVVVTRPFFANFFADIPQLSVECVDLDKEHKGFSGLVKLARQLKKKYKPVAFFDLHSVLRSQVVSRAINLMGVPVYRIHKDREAKKKAIASKDFSTPFKTTFERYAIPFRQYGIDFEPAEAPLFGFLEESDHLFMFFDVKKDWDKTIKIGIAPFAMHKQKIWPAAYVNQLMDHLQARYNCSIFLYGGGDEELAAFQQWIDGKRNRYMAAKVSNIKEEINLMAQMDVMLAMDSGNMHFAALANTPVFSIWGGTSPKLGFSPYKVDPNFIIEPQEDFPCRPCSVFGGKPCIYADKVRCMHAIKPEQVFKRMSAFLDKSKLAQ